MKTCLIPPILPCSASKRSGTEGMGKQVEKRTSSCELPVRDRLAPQASVPGVFCPSKSKRGQTRHVFIDTTSIQTFGTERVGVSVRAALTSCPRKASTLPACFALLLARARSQAHVRFRPPGQNLARNRGGACLGKVLRLARLGLATGLVRVGSPDRCPCQDRFKRSVASWGMCILRGMAFALPVESKACGLRFHRKQPCFCWQDFEGVACGRWQADFLPSPNGHAERASSHGRALSSCNSAPWPAYGHENMCFEYPSTRWHRCHNAARCVACV